jgi:fatty-acyl-CoA synthase
MAGISLTESCFPAVREAPVEPITIGDLLRRQAREHADTVALKEIGSDGAIGRSWTYARLLDDAERLGRALASRHPPGARIAVYANNLPEWVLLELGCALAGVTLVTVNPAYQKRELKYVLEQ